jgi:hypothetical protein
MRRRPSASLVVSFVALFVALGGVGYAASQLPANSVGSAQLQNGSVGNWKLKSNSVGSRKIINGSVGAKQVDSRQVQLRVATACATGAISAIGLSGSATCTPSLPNEIGKSASAVTLATGSTTVATETLPLGFSFLVLAYPHAVITGTTGQHVEVDCTLSVPGAASTNSVTKSLAVDVASSAQSPAGSIPLALPVGSATSAQTVSVNCKHTSTPSSPAPTVSVDTTINAIQTASNG